MLALGAMALGVLGSYAKFGPGNQIPESERKPPVRGEDRSVIVYQPKFEDDLRFESRRELPPASADRMVYAVNAYLKEANLAPEGAAAKSCRLEGRTAVLDFTAPFRSTYGTEDERTLIEGILREMGQFREVDDVRFLVEGKPIETLGNIELTDPQPVIRDAPVRP